MKGLTADVGCMFPSSLCSTVADLKPASDMHTQSMCEELIPKGRHQRWTPMLNKTKTPIKQSSFCVLVLRVARLENVLRTMRLSI